MKVTDFKLPKQDQNALNDVNNASPALFFLRYFKLVKAFVKLSYSKGIFSFSFDALIVLNLLVIQYYVLFYLYLAITTMADIIYPVLCLILLFILKKLPLLWKKKKK